MCGQGKRYPGVPYYDQFHAGGEMDESRLIEIEAKLAHQDQLLIELNNVVTDQQAQLTRLEELCSLLVERIRSLGDDRPDGSGGSSQGERPPHY